MALTIDWANRIINVPRADMLLIQSNPIEIRQLDIDAFRLELKDIEDDEGMPYPDTHAHVSPISVGGVELARVVQMINGYTVTFEDGQYAVNLVGANSNIGDVINVNQVSVRSANSAGLTFSSIINSQSFLDASVFIDIGQGRTGTSFPRGTPQDPVNNLVDAVIIGNRERLKSYKVSGALTHTTNVGDGVNWSGYGPARSFLTLTGNDVTGDEFLSLYITGTQLGAAEFRECQIGPLTGFSGKMVECLIEGPIQVAATATEATLYHCDSDVPAPNRPELDLSQATCGVQVKGYHGGMTVTGLTAAASLTLDIDSGTIEIASSCTGGLITIRGICKVIDNSAPGCTVVRESILDTDTQTRFTEMYRRQGLDPSYPVTATPTSITFGDVTIDLTGDGETSKTATRQ